MESPSPKPSFCNEKRQKTLNNLLLDSSSQGHIINVKKWIRAGAEIDTSDNGGDEEIVVDFDNLETCLAKYKAENRRVFTPLQLALSCQIGRKKAGLPTRSYYEVVEYLLKKGASPNSEVKAINHGQVVKYTPAFWAVMNDSSIGILKLLIKHGADLNFKNYVERDEGLLYHAIGKSFEIVELLLKNGVDAKYANKINGSTPLHHAVQERDLRIAKLLMSYGADLNAINFDDQAPIHCAVRAKNLKMVKLLIEHGVDINSKPEKYYSPLQIAVLNKDYELVKFLLENGANVNQRTDNEGDISTTPLHLACHAGHDNIAEILMKYGADVDALEDTEVMEKSTPLHYAALKGLHLIVRNLLKKGANFELQTSFGNTALHLAARSGYASIVKLLHKKGAQINTKNSKKNTPLHEVAENGHQIIVEYLIKNGAELEAKDGLDRTPLQCAVGAFKTADFKQLAVVECLLTYGANANVGRAAHIIPSPLEMASLMKKETEFNAKGKALEKLLLKYGANFKNWCIRKVDAEVYEKEKVHRKEKDIVDIRSDHVLELMQVLNDPSSFEVQRVKEFFKNILNKD